MTRLAARLSERLGVEVRPMRVYRWRYQRGSNGGGAGGLVPAEFQRAILDEAQARGLPLDAWDLIPGPRPACCRRAEG